MPRKRRINPIFDPVLTIDATKTDVQKLVYILVANRPIKYENDYSRIVYIGTTEQGIKRIAGSASKRVKEAYEKLRGVKRIDAYVVWTKARAGPDTFRGKGTWHVLETALLLKFKKKYGEKSRLNAVEKNFGNRQEYAFELFKEQAVGRIIGRYA